MNSISNPLLMDHFRLEAKTPFNVVIAYEDFAAARRAKRLYESLLRALGDELAFDLSLWRFEVLALPRLREVATQQAAEANMVIVSTSAERDLGREVKQWLETGLKQRENFPTSLVALSGGCGVAYDSNPAHVSLRAMAFRYQLDFFAHTVDEDELGLARVSRPARHWDAWFLQGTLFDEVPSFAHCGINE